MKPRLLKVFVYPTLMSAYSRNEVNIVVRVLKGSIDVSKIYSKIGFKGDTWVIAEHGQLHNKNVFQRSDGTAVLKTLIGEHVDVITPYGDREGESVCAEDMPKWAARYLYEIMDVSLPKLLDRLDEDIIYNMGVREHPVSGDLKNYVWGGIEVPGKDGIKEAFKKLWNITYNRNGLCGFESNTYVTCYKIIKK